MLGTAKEMVWHLQRSLLRPFINSMTGKRSVFVGTRGLKKFTVCVEGNIGSGKTTFLQLFEKFENLVETYDEPVTQWRDFGGENPLASMYGNPGRWACTFQALVLLTLMKRHTQSQEKPVRVMERSVYSARYCFTENLRQRGFLTDLEYTILTQWFEFALRQSNCKVDLIVYLQTCPEVCYERIKNRNRPEEQIVTVDYLRQLHHLHEDWLIHGSSKGMIRPPVLLVNGNHDLPTMKNKFANIQSKILAELYPDIFR